MTAQRTVPGPEELRELAVRATEAYDSDTSRYWLRREAHDALTAAGYADSPAGRSLALAVAGLVEALRLIVSTAGLNVEETEAAYRALALYEGKKEG